MPAPAAGLQLGPKLQSRCPGSGWLTPTPPSHAMASSWNQIIEGIVMCRATSLASSILTFNVTS